MVSELRTGQFLNDSERVAEAEPGRPPKRPAGRRARPVARPGPQVRYGLCVLTWTSLVPAMPARVGSPERYALTKN